MIKVLLNIVISWYSFFSVNPLENKLLGFDFVCGNPAQFGAGAKLASLSSALWGYDTQVSELLLLRNRFWVDFVFYDFGSFRFANIYPDDEVNLNYDAFAYKVSVGYVIPLESSMYLGIAPQYNRFEYFNRAAEGFTANIGFYHSVKTRFNYEIFLKDFGLSSSEDFNFPASLNLAFGLEPFRNFGIKLILRKYVSDNFLDSFTKGMRFISSINYIYRDVFGPNVNFYLGDDFRIFDVGIKFRILKSFFVGYDLTLRKNGFVPVHTFTLGVK